MSYGGPALFGPEQAAPVTALPSGFGYCWLDSTTHTWVCRQNGGTNTGVVAKDCNALMAGDFVYAISAGGVISCGTPTGGGGATHFIPMPIGGGPLFGAGFIPAWALNTVGAVPSGSAAYAIINLSQTGTVTIIRQFRWPADWNMAGNTQFKYTLGQSGIVGNFKLDVSLSCASANYASPTYGTAVSSGSVAIAGGFVAIDYTIPNLSTTGCVAGDYAVIQVSRDNSVSGNAAGNIGLLDAAIEQ